jgi:hypothetical protein
VHEAIEAGAVTAGRLACYHQLIDHPA